MPDQRATKKLDEEFYGKRIDKRILLSPEIIDTILDPECTYIETGYYQIAFPPINRYIISDSDYIRIAPWVMKLNRLFDSTGISHSDRLVESYKKDISNILCKIAYDSIRMRRYSTLRAVAVSNASLPVDTVLVPDIPDLYYTDKVILKRDPVLSQNSIAIVNIKLWKENAIAIHPGLMKRKSGDHDGDTLTLYSINKELKSDLSKIAAYIESIKALTENNLISENETDLTMTQGIGLVKSTTGPVCGIANAIIAYIDATANPSIRRMIIEDALKFKARIVQVVIDLKWGLKGRNGRSAIHYFDLLAFCELLRSGYDRVYIENKRYDRIDTFVKVILSNENDNENYKMFAKYFVMEFGNPGIRIYDLIAERCPGYKLMRTGQFEWLKTTLESDNQGMYSELIKLMFKGEKNDKNTLQLHSSKFIDISASNDEWRKETDSSSFEY